MIAVTKDGTMMETVRRGEEFWEITTSSGVVIKEAPCFIPFETLIYRNILFVRNIIPYFIHYFGITKGVEFCCDNAMYKVMKHINEKFPTNNQTDATGDSESDSPTAGQESNATGNRGSV